MDRKDCCLLISTTPKYFYILEPMIGLLRRYAPDLKWPVYLATEKYDDFQIQRICKTYDVQILKLAEEDADFLESRVAAVKKLPPEIKYLIPWQDDFLIERLGYDTEALGDALRILDTEPNVLSLRLTPCPGAVNKEVHYGRWNKLGDNDMIFSYQSTIWRREVFTNYMERLIQQGREQNPGISGKAWNQYCINVNPAETHTGFYLMKSLYPMGIHLCYPRRYTCANGVLWTPLSYKPTAIVKGVLQPWAEELIHREGFKTMPSLR